MPDTGAPWNIPYIDPTDLVIDYPVANEDMADAVAAGLTSASTDASLLTTGTVAGARLPGFVLSAVIQFVSTATYTVPSGVRAIRVRVQGGGGGGATSSTNDNVGTGGGGGGGGYAERFVTSLDATYTVTVGGASGEAGTGNNSSVGSLAVGNGGGGSTSRVGGAGGSGTATGGFVVKGAKGRGGRSDGFDNLGCGGASFLGPGQPGTVGTGGTRVAGVAGEQFGGGGSSFLCQTGAVRGGSTGAAGIVIIEEYK